MPLQPVSAGNRPATTVDPVKVLKQLSPVTNGNKKPEGKENQSTDSSLESNESSQMVTKSEPVGLEGSSDGNQQSSVIVCQVLKRQEEQLNQMQLQVRLTAFSGNIMHMPVTLILVVSLVFLSHQYVVIGFPTSQCFVTKEC